MSTRFLFYTGFLCSFGEKTPLSGASFSGGMDPRDICELFATEEKPPQRYLASTIPHLLEFVHWIFLFFLFFPLSWWCLEDCLDRWGVLGLVGWCGIILRCLCVFGVVGKGGAISLYIYKDIYIYLVCVSSPPHKQQIGFIPSSSLSLPPSFFPSHSHHLPIILQEHPPASI